MNIMKKIIIALGIILLAGAVVWLATDGVLFGEKQEEAHKTKTAEAPPFVPRYSETDLMEKVAARKAERGGLPTESAADRARDARSEAYWKKNLEMQNRTPDEAIAQAEKRLTKIEKELSETTDPKERERLNRHKEMVAQVLSKLNQMKK
jgi:hypothetical protein